MVATRAAIRLLDNDGAGAGDLGAVQRQPAMVIGVKRHRNLVAALWQAGDMVPVAIDTPELHPVHIDMRMPVPLDIAAPGGGGIKGEVAGLHIQVPSADRISIDGGVQRRFGRPVIDRDHHRGVAGMLAAALGRHGHAVCCGRCRGQQLGSCPEDRGTDQRAPDEGHQQAAALRSLRRYVVLVCA